MASTTVRDQHQHQDRDLVQPQLQVQLQGQARIPLHAPWPADDVPLPSSRFALPCALHAKSEDVASRALEIVGVGDRLGCVRYRLQRRRVSAIVPQSWLARRDVAQRFCRLQRYAGHISSSIYNHAQAFETGFILVRHVAIDNGWRPAASSQQPADSCIFRHGRLGYGSICSPLPTASYRLLPPLTNTLSVPLRALLPPHHPVNPLGRPRLPPLPRRLSPRPQLEPRRSPRPRPRSHVA